MPCSNDLMISKEYINQLIERAKEARLNAYAPYSNFKVGAVAIGDTGNIYLGCNVENASYGLAICAERSAIANAVASGEKHISLVLVLTEGTDIARPCGACLQVISEFSLKENPTTIIVANTACEYEIFTISDYLPMAFELENKFRKKLD